MILYVSARSSSLACRLAFVLSGLPGEIREISLRAGEHRTPEYLAINPRGQVPALVLDDGEVLTETAAILVAIGEMAPQSGLIPEAQAARWRVMKWLAWYAWNAPRSFLPAMMPSLYGPPQAENQIREAALKRVDALLAEIDAALAGRDWLAGDHLTAADLCVAMLTVFAGFLAIAPPDALMAHRARIFALPVLAGTLKAEGFAT